MLLPAKVQVFFGVVCILAVLSCTMLVLWNYDEYPEARFEERMFKSKYEYPRLLEINMIVFLTTMISTSREALLVFSDRCLKYKVSPFLLGLINVTIKLICLTLFDFRLIHIYNTLITTRYTILFADITSLLLAESIRGK